MDWCRDAQSSDILSDVVIYKWAVLHSQLFWNICGSRAAVWACLESLLEMWWWSVAVIEIIQEGSAGFLSPGKALIYFAPKYP